MENHGIQVAKELTNTLHISNKGKISFKFQPPAFQKASAYIHSKCSSMVK